MKWTHLSTGTQDMIKCEPPQSGQRIDHSLNDTAMRLTGSWLPSLLYTKVSKWIKDLNMEGKITKIIEEKYRIIL